MFKGYKLEKIDFKKNLDFYYKKGLGQYNNHRIQIERSLKTFIESDKSLNGTKIIDKWFPEIKSNIFISHSHKDEPIVVALAGWLYVNFEITSFIDSCIWGYGNDLIKILDDEYSWMDKANNIYYYNKVLNSSSHVHMMLSTALSNMIDKTECLIFYDTPNSIEPFKTVEKTDSPWIYSEIAFSQIVRQTIPERLSKPIRETKYFNAEGDDYFEKSLKIKYEINSSHLKTINAETLSKWVDYPNKYKGEDALDILYEITHPIAKLNS